MKNKILLILLAGVLAISLSVVSCDEEEEELESPAATIAEVGSIGLSIQFLQEHPYYLSVELKPTISALADTPYIVELYEKGRLRDSTTVCWNQPELNVLKTKEVYFPITKAEYDAYFGEYISHIFSIEVHE